MVDAPRISTYVYTACAGRDKIQRRKEINLTQKNNERKKETTVGGEKKKERE